MSQLLEKVSVKKVGENVLGTGRGRIRLIQIMCTTRGRTGNSQHTIGKKPHLLSGRHGRGPHYKKAWLGTNTLS